MPKPTLWLLCASMEDAEVPMVVPTLVWTAQAHGAELEMYLEAKRDGQLFARTGSTVLGGQHHHQFNYLCAAFDVRALLLGDTSVFASSLTTFGIPILAQACCAADLYGLLHDQGLLSQPDCALFAPAHVQFGNVELEIAPYIFPDVYFRRALGFLPESAAQAVPLLQRLGVQETYGVLLDEQQKALLPTIHTLDSVAASDDYGTLTMRAAQRWKHKAEGVVFGDPSAVLSQLATHCRQRRVAVYAPRADRPAADIRFGAYVEETSAIGPAVTKLALEIGNPVITGRQTTDGDLFEWAKGGVCIQIVDPNRPPFPIVETVIHKWAKPQRTLYDLEPSDEQLRHFAAERKVLATLLWHSGEIAHNEAMTNVMDLAAWTGLKMGIGVHAQRYQTCPQLWEMLNVPVERGGLQGLIEPVLYSGGMGIMAEINCPADTLRDHCLTALERIRSIAGPEATPRGYHAFMDSSLEDLTRVRVDVFEAIADAGLDYMVSCAIPGRNRIIWQKQDFLVLNQSCRTILGGSPFVRILGMEGIRTSGHTRPGWLVTTLDAPVVANNPYIWRSGSDFMQVVDYLLTNQHIINVTPHVVARYARLLNEQGYLPGSYYAAPSEEGEIA